LRHDDPEGIYQELSSLEMKELRNFLEDEIIFLGKTEDSVITKGHLREAYPSVQEYYRKQDCHEPLEACIDESCLKSNPVCFSIKMRTQMEFLLHKLEGIS
jgi:hypothetical protein